MSAPAAPLRIVLDSSPLSRLAHPNARTPVNAEINAWLSDRLAAGAVVVVPEIADYELRRELLRSGRGQGLARLAQLEERLPYLPLDTPTLRRAAEIWAEARNQGLPTAPPDALDIDVILAAQAESVTAIVATENVGHLARFVEARHWRDIG